MTNRHLTVLLSSAFLVLAGCASVEQTSVQAYNATERGSDAPTQISIPVLSKPDNGVKLQSGSGARFQQTMFAMVDPLKEAERSYLTRAIFFVAQYESCIKSGRLTANTGESSTKDSNRNLTPEDCYKKRGKIHEASSNRRWEYGKYGRPDGNKRVQYFSLATGNVDSGWSSGEAWDRYSGFVNAGANEMTRTEIQTYYHTIMGKRSEKIISDTVGKVDDVLANPLGAILSPIL